nr:unnamed protein product [Spirometra erinaceieuropaei]
MSLFHPVLWILIISGGFYEVDCAYVDSSFYGEPIRFTVHGRALLRINFYMTEDKPELGQYGFWFFCVDGPW